MPTDAKQPGETGAIERALTSASHRIRRSVVDAARAEHAALVAALREARADLAAVTETARVEIAGFRERVVALEAELAEARRERDEARKNYQFMVNRAADEKLDGYRELGARVAAAEEARDAAIRRAEESDAALRAQTEALETVVAECNDLREDLVATGKRAEEAEVRAEAWASRIPEVTRLAHERALAAETRIREMREALSDKADAWETMAVLSTEEHDTLVRCARNLRCIAEGVEKEPVHLSLEDSARTTAEARLREMTEKVKELAKFDWHPASSKDCARCEAVTDRLRALAEGGGKETK
jgi:chromosome segregation ATPase